MMRQYFVAVVLPPELDKKVLLLKQWMLDHHGCKVALRAPAHITLVPPFWMDEEKEEVLHHALEQLSQIQPFTLLTNGFSSFPPKTIFIATEENTSLEALKIKASGLLEANESFRIKAETRPFVPHITIANRDLHKKSFHEAWNYFQKKEFKEQWNVEDIGILKHDGERWNVIDRIVFRETE